MNATSEVESAFLVLAFSAAQGQQSGASSVVDIDWRRPAGSFWYINLGTVCFLKVGKDPFLHSNKPLVDKNVFKSSHIFTCVNVTTGTTALHNNNLKTNALNQKSSTITEIIRQQKDALIIQKNPRGFSEK